MQIDALGYVGIQTADLEQWATYGTRFLGMQLVGKSHGTLGLRMDDRKQRVIVHAGEGEGVSFDRPVLVLDLSGFPRRWLNFHPSRAIQTQSPAPRLPNPEHEHD